MVILEFCDQISHGAIPCLDIRSRTKHNNVQSDGCCVLSDKTTRKSSKNISGMKQMLQFANAVLFLIDQFKTKKNSTSRELCHVSEGWEFSKFENQADSNCPIENLQALIGHPRQEFRIWSESNGHVFGSVVPREHTG